MPPVYCLCPECYWCRCALSPRCSARRTAQYLLLADARVGLHGGAIAAECAFYLTFSNVYAFCTAPAPAGTGREISTKLLELYCENMVEKAAATEPVIGREREMTQLLQVLSRKNKNNPALIGEPGVGKTAIVEGLAQRLAAGTCRAAARQCLYSLNLASILAGTKYRGEFEEPKISAMCSRSCAAAGMPTSCLSTKCTRFVGAGSAEGAIDAAICSSRAGARGATRSAPRRWRSASSSDTAASAALSAHCVAERAGRRQKRSDGPRPGLERHHPQARSMRRCSSRAGSDGASFCRTRRGPAGSERRADLAERPCTCVARRMRCFQGAATGGVGCRFDRRRSCATGWRRACAQVQLSSPPFVGRMRSPRRSRTRTASRCRSAAVTAEERLLTRAHG